MHLHDRLKMAFIMPFGAFCYLTMTFGLINAGATFQCCRQKCLLKQLGRNAHVYVDDIVAKAEKRGTLFRGDVHFRHTDAARFPVGQMHAGQRLLIPPVERLHGQIGTNLFHCTHLPRRFCAYYVRGLSFHAICAQKLTCFLSLGLAMERLTWYHIAVNCKAWR